MYLYFLGSPTGDSQNGASGVNFTEHGFLPDRGCSQPIFHGWSKQESSQRGSGDRCSLEDSKIHRETKTPSDNGPHLSPELTMSILIYCYLNDSLFTNHVFFFSCQEHPQPCHTSTPSPALITLHRSIHVRRFIINL